MPPDAIPPDPHALLDVLERVLDDGERPPEWPTVHRQLAPLVGVAHVALSFDGRRRLRTWLRDARDHPTLYALGLALALRTAADAEAPEREALERVRALDDPAAIAEALGRELTPEERAGLAPTRVEASDARHNAEIVGPHNEAAFRPDRLSPREKIQKFRSLSPARDVEPNRASRHNDGAGGVAPPTSANGAANGGTRSACPHRA